MKFKDSLQKELEELIAKNNSKLMFSKGKLIYIAPKLIK